MTARLLRSVLALAAAAVALRAVAHEVDCSSLAGLVRPQADGTPLLDPDGLPSFAAAPGATLTVNRYPALVALDVSILNLAQAPSIVESVVVPAVPDAGRVRSFGDTLVGTVPVAGALRRVFVVPVQSYQDCLTQFSTPSAGTCGGAPKAPAFTVTTESDVAQCSARVVCRPALPPAPSKASPPPALCTGPSWTGARTLDLGGFTRAFGAATACDGTTWVAASALDAFAPPPTLGTVVGLDPAGQLTSFPVLPSVPTSVRLDRAGNLDVAGVGPSGAMAAQYDATGALRWVYQVPDAATGATVATAVSPAALPRADVDPSSNVVLGYVASVAGQADVVVTKLSPGGTVLWTQRLGTPQNDYLFDLATGPDGSVDVAGMTGGVFPGNTVIQGNTAFLAHLDPDGNVLWVRQLAGLGNTPANAVAVDPASGLVAVAGAVEGSLDGAPSSSLSDAFVAVYDTTGALRWLRQLRGVPSTSPGAAVSAQGVAFDATGAVWIAGNVDLGTMPGGTALGAQDGFAARYDAAGTLLWTRELGTASWDAVTGIAIDPSGSGIVTGYAQPAFHEDGHVTRVAPDGT